MVAAKKPAKKAVKKAAPRKAAKKAPRKKKVTPIPGDTPSISAHLTVADVKKAMALYQKAFGLTLMGEPMMAGKVVIHAVLGHAGSMVMLGSASPDGAHLTPNAQGIVAQAFGLYVYVKDVDAHHKKVKRFKGLKVSAPQDTFWGDRMYDVVDRDGHRWTFASRKSIPTPEEMAEAMQAMMNQG